VLTERFGTLSRLPARSVFVLDILHAHACSGSGRQRDAMVAEPGEVAVADVEVVDPLVDHPTGVATEVLLEGILVRGDRTPAVGKPPTHPLETPTDPRPGSHGR